MTFRSWSSASIATVLLCGLNTAPASAQNTSLLPAEESAVITATGCLQRGGKEVNNHYILASPRLGAVANVADGACNEPIDAQAVELEDADDHGINPTLVGHWVEINGRLERETSTNPNNLRELKVRSFRLVPVVPRRAEVAPAPLPAPVLESPAPAPLPAAPPTAIAEPLPRTASPLAMIGLLGLLSSAAALGFRMFRSRS